MIELEVWQVVALMVIPFISLTAGLLLGLTWRRETIRALEKSLEDARDALQRVDGGKTS